MRIKRREWNWVWVFAALVMALTTVPYGVGASQPDSAWRFSGFVIGVEDGNSYLAKMQLGAHGQWLFQLTYAIEDHPPSLVFLFFILLGKLIGALVGTGDPVRLHDALVIGFHAARIVFGLALVLVTYGFLAELLPRIRQRRLALMTIFLGGGLGWLLIAIPNAGQPLEFYSPETFSFLHLYLLPHLSAVRALMLSGLLFYLRAVRGRWPLAFAAGLAWLLMTLIQPFYMVIVLIILIAHVAMLGVLAFRQSEQELVRGVDLGASAMRALWVSVLAGAFGLPLVVYTFLLFLADPVYRAWGAQNIILSPPAWHYLSAWGLLAIAGAFGLRSFYRRNLAAWALVVGWLAVVPFLLYVPYNLQRRFAEGVHVPLAALAVLGLTVGIGSGRAQRFISRYAPLALIALTLPAIGLVWIGGLVTALQPKEPAFQTRDQAATYAFLAKSLPTRAVVVSSYEFGNAIPAYGYLVAFMGHGPETPNLEEKRAWANEFYDALTSDEQRHYLYDTQGAPYVVIGPHENKIGQFDPRLQADYLHLIFQSGDYSVWALK